MAKNKKRKSNIIFILIFIMGFVIFTYPMISNYYYRIEANNQVKDFDEAKASLSAKEIEERMRLAIIYNDELANVIKKDPYSDDEKSQAMTNYAKMLELREKIGTIRIPSINVKLPIYAGTSEEVLQKAAGHLEGTSLPIGGRFSHTVITAHSGLPSARLFTDLVKVKIGDRFYIQNIKETLAYKVDQIKVIEPSDFSDLLIVDNEDYATLLTCTPIMINTHRLLVRGTRIAYDDQLDKKIIEEVGTNLGPDLRVIILLTFILLIIFNLIYRYIKKRIRAKNAKKT